MLQKENCVRYIVALCIFFGKGEFLFAQTANGILRGRVLDAVSNAPLELASISVYELNDSSFNIKTSTRGNGTFEIKELPVYKKFQLVISYTGYRVYHKEFSIGDKESLTLDNIVLTVLAKELDTVTVKAEIPSVIIRKDTVEYNAASFKTRPNAVVEELLRKLPGLIVDNYGNITFNGRPVSKVLVDGKEFFVGNSLMATRNLPADLVSKIQVADTKTFEQLFNNLPSNGADKTINIQLKNTKNDLFGYIHGGLGTESRYELSGMANYFDSNRKLTIIGSGNNINNVGFGSGNDLGVVSPGNGIIESGLTGLNYNDVYNKYVNISGSYFFQQTSTDNESAINRKQMILTDSSLFSNSQNNQTERNKTHKAQFAIEYIPDSLNMLKFTPETVAMNFQNKNNNNVITTSSNGDRINESNGSIADGGSSENYSFQFFWGRKLNNKGRSITVSFGGAQYRQRSNSLNQSKNIFYKENSVDSINFINQQATTVDHNNDYGINLVYNEPISKSLKLILHDNVEITNSNTSKKTYALDSNGHILAVEANYSGNFSSNTTINLAEVSMEYTQKKIDVSAGVTGIYNQLNNHSNEKNNLWQQQINFAPVGMIIYHIDKTQNIHLNYSANTQQPTVEQLQPIPDNSNPLYVKIGNPDLKPAFNQNYSIRYSKFNSSQIIDGGIQYTPQNNKIINGLRYDDYGRQISKFVNVNGIFGLNGNVSIKKNKKAENSNKYLSFAVAGNYFRDVSLVNNENIISKVRDASFQIDWGYSYKELFVIDFGYNLAYNNVRYNNSVQQQVEYVIQTINNNVSVLLKAFRLISSINYSYNSNVPPGFKPNSLLWNIGITQSFLKGQKAQIKLIIYDLLKQNTNLHRTISNNYIEDMQSNILQQYALLGLTYYLRNNTKKAR